MPASIIPPIGINTVEFILSMLFYSSFIWIPAFLLIILWDLWVQYRRGLFFAKQEYVLLEVKLPKEIFKSPKAMEFCIDSLWNTLGEANWYERYWKGSVRVSHSFEIVSIGGSVHFFIWTRKGTKKQIEANLYSQYPGVEIFDVPDYTLPVSYDPEVTSMFATEFKLDKADSFPIKTYIDYGMERDPKEEFKLDPMTPLIEFMGSLSQGNQAWLQIIIRAHKKEERDPDKKWQFWNRKDLRWSESAKKEIADIIARGKGEKGDDGKIVPGSTRFLTEDEQETIKALGRSVSKKGFDVGMRLIYTAPKDIFNISNLGGLISGVFHFNSSLNGFKLTGGLTAKYESFFLVWKNRNVKKIDLVKQIMLDAYKRRAYFYTPYKKPHFILNTEELATLFHLPGGVSSTPTFTRIESRKGEAPANLPI